LFSPLQFRWQRPAPLRLNPVLETAAARADPVVEEPARTFANFKRKSTS
jgi:hypothetical protein